MALLLSGYRLEVPSLTGGLSTPGLGEDGTGSDLLVLDVAATKWLFTFGHVLTGLTGGFGGPHKTAWTTALVQIDIGITEDANVHADTDAAHGGKDMLQHTQ